MRVWEQPQSQLERLKKFQFVCSPDFSIYTDFPKVLQIYSHYKKHWCAAYWQDNGIKVIPTICWGDESTFEWCFDGTPTQSTVAVSSVGTQNNEETKRLFLQGYNAMLERLQPENIIFYGNIPDECKGDILHVKSYQEKFRIARMEMK